MNRTLFSTNAVRYGTYLGVVLTILFIARNMLLAKTPTSLPGFSWMEWFIVAALIVVAYRAAAWVFAKKYDTVDAMYEGASVGLIGTGVASVLYFLVSLVLYNMSRPLPELFSLAPAGFGSWFYFMLKGLIGALSIGTLLGALAGLLPYIWRTLWEDDTVPVKAVTEKKSDTKEVRTTAKLADTDSTLTPLHVLPGIEKAHLERFYKVGIEYVETLLDKAKTAPLRADLAEETGVPAKKLLTYVNYADLMRLPAVTPAMAKLLEVAGVDTIVELGKRNAASLYEKLSTINTKEKIVNSLMHKAEVEELVEAASKLKRVISY